jgi:transcriptional regulator with XRE-family HTH domain/KaiC/GvpD/RAD55 family RecA-like ATPase
LGGLRQGDNLVWEAEAGTYIDLFVEKFIHYSLTLSHRVIYISFNRSPMTVSQRLKEFPNQPKLTLVDCFTAGKGNNDQTFSRFYSMSSGNFAHKVVKMEQPGDIANFIEILGKIEEEQDEGTRYIFDSLTGMQHLWEDETKTYRFFTYHCPRLFDLKTVAYWILEKEAHTSAFRANLRHVTQIAIDLSYNDEQMFLKVGKAEGRSSPSLYKPQKFEVWDDSIVFRQEEVREIIDLGGKVKALRQEFGLSQKDLAEKTGHSASFISQLERNLISPSIDSLVQLSNKLNTEPAYFFTQPTQSLSNDIILRKNQRTDYTIDSAFANGIKCQRLTSDSGNRRMEALMITFAEDANISAPLLPRKGDELIIIIKGELEIAIKNQKYILREGDTVYLSSVVPQYWRNIGEIPVQAIWVLSPPGS